MIRALSVEEFATGLDVHDSSLKGRHIPDDFLCNAAIA
jgi:hypothetical protein